MLITKGYYNWLQKKKHYVVVVMYLVQIHSGPLPRVKYLQIQDFVQFPFPLPFLPPSPSGVVCKYLLLKGKKNQLTVMGDWRLERAVWGMMRQFRKLFSEAKLNVQFSSWATLCHYWTSLPSTYLSHYRWRYLQSQRRRVWNVGGSWSARRWRYSCGSSTGPGSDQALNKWLCFFFFFFLGLQTVCCFSFLNSFQVYSIILWRWL